MAVVDLVAIGELNDLLGIERRMLERRHRRVGQDIIQKIGTNGAGITEIADLNRRGTMREHFGAELFREAFQIDGDIDFMVPQFLRDRRVAVALHVVKVIARVGDASTHIAAVVAAERKRVHLEAPAVMQLEQLRHQERSRVGLQVGRQVSQPDAIMPVDLAGPKRRRPHRHTVSDEIARRLEMQRRIVTEADQRERRDARLAGGQLGIQPGCHYFGAGKIADRQRGIEAAEFIGMAGIKSARLFIAREQFIVALDLLQRIPAIVERVGLIGHERQYPIVAFERFGMALQLLECRAPAVPGLNVTWLQRQCAVIARQRLLQPPQLEQRVALVVVRLGIVGLQRSRTGEACKRLLVAIERSKDVAAIVVCLGIVGLRVESAGDEHQRLVGAALLEPENAEIVAALHMLGLLPQNLLVERLSVGKLSALVKTHRASEHLRQVARRAHRRLSWPWLTLSPPRRLKDRGRSTRCHFA